LGELMSISRSVKKRLRQSNKRRLRNKQRQSAMNTAIKKVKNAITLNEQDTIRNAIRIIAKTASKGIIHKKNASNKISKIMLKNLKINKNVL